MEERLDEEGGGFIDVEAGLLTDERVEVASVPRVGDVLDEIRDGGALRGGRPSFSLQ